MTAWRRLASALRAGIAVPAMLPLLPLLGGCVCHPCLPASQAAAGQSTAATASPPAPATLRWTWMIGIEQVWGDADPRLPFTNRLLADLAAMPKVQVVYIGTVRNAFPFAASQVRSIRLSTWLHAAGNCMTANYTLYDAGQQQGSYALVVPSLAAGSETDLACIDRFATAFYQGLARQGF